MTLNSKVLSTLSLTLLLAGFAPSPVPSTTVAGTCSLITRQEAAAALGAAVPAGAEKDMAFPVQGRPIKAHYCFYGSEVAIARYELGGGAAALFSQYRQSLASKSDYQSVRGVGDEAFFAKGQLSVRKGQTGLIVDVGQARGGGAKEEQAEKKLAGLAIGRL